MMGPGDPFNDKTPADGPTIAADGDAASRTVHLDSPESGAAHVTAPSEGRDLPTMPGPTSGESFDTFDPAAFIPQINPPTAAHSSSPRGEHVGAEVERTVTVLPSVDPSAVPTMAKADDRASPTLREGPVPAIDGYEILGVLGRGGMGVVYRARQVLLNRPCALKMILAGAHAGALAAVRFLAEAEAIARLKHPNIIQIHHIGEADGLPYFELEYVEGGSLDKLLDGTPWPARRAAGLVEVPVQRSGEALRLRLRLGRGPPPVPVGRADRGATCRRLGAGREVGAASARPGRTRRGPARGCGRPARGGGVVVSSDQAVA